MILIRVPFRVVQFALLLTFFQTSLRLYAQGTPLTLGNTNTGTIALPGQEDRFTFAGTVGQRLFFDRFDLDGEAIQSSMTSPNGASIFSVGSASDHGPFYLTEAGTYTVLLDGTGDATGSYSFRMVDLASASPITYGPANPGQLAPRSAMLAYRFEGTNGQRINVESISASIPGEGIWYLYSPANVALLTTYGLENSPGEAVLPMTGTYLLLAVGTTGDTGPLDFQFRVSLLSNPSGGSSGFGTVRSGTVLADQTNSFTVTGPAGLPVYFDALTNASEVTVYFVSPSDELVFAVNGASDSGPYVLPRSGTYTVDVVAGANDAGFLFRLLDLNASSVPITVGTVYGQNFAAISPYRADVYRFTGSVGQRVYIDALEPEYDNLNGTVFRPNGTVLGGFQYNDYYDGNPVTLDLPGTYYLILANYNDDGAGDYLFRWLDGGQPPAVTVPFDVTVKGTNAYGDGVSLYRFTGSAGQRLFFDAAATNAGGNWNLFAPNDVNIASIGLSSDFEVKLPGNGTYLLAAGNFGVTNVSSFSFQIVTPTTTNLALTLGALVTGQLNEPGEEDRYTFIGVPGQRLYFDSTRYDQPSLSVILLSPSGNNVHINQGADVDAGTFTLTEAGTYTLVLKATTEVTGSYGFRLIDVAQTPAMTVGFDTPVNGTNLPASSASVYRFTGTAGQRLFFDGLGTNAGSWQLYSPDNAPFGAYGLNGDFEVTLPTTGTYVLAAGNLSETNAAAFSFRIVTPTTTTSALTFATTVNGTLSELGEEDRFTFTGSVGQRIWYDGLQSDFQNLTAYLVAPSGGSVFGGNSDSDQGMFILTEAGLYTLVQKAAADVTGSYSFRVLDLATSPAVTYGAPVTNQLNPHLESDLYRFAGVAGQRIVVTNLVASDANANWFLYAPNLASLASGNIQTSLGEVVLPAAGTYALLIAGGVDVGTLNYAFRIDLISSASGAVSGFATMHSGTTTLDQTNSFSYIGPAGRPVFFDALTSNPTTTVRLIAPNGEVVFTTSGGADAGPYFLPRNGSYTLEVVGTGDGSYHFRLLDLVNDSISATFGTTYTQSLTPPFRTDVYRFDATNGQRVFYDAEKPYFDLSYTIRQTTYSPFGSSLVNSQAAYDSDTGVVPDTGTYYVALGGDNPTDAIEYSFRLLDATRPPSAAITLDTVVSGTNDPSTRQNLYRFTGTAGQRLFFDAASTNAGGSWYLYGLNGNYLGGTYMFYDFELTLPSSGQYFLTAGNDSQLDPMSYSFQIITPNSTTNPLTLATITTGSLAEVGEEDWFTFTAAAGQRLYYDSLDNDGDSLVATIYDPLGNALIGTGAETDYGPFTLSVSGTYRLRLKHSGDGTGNYRFRLLDTATATTLPYDTVINGFVTNTYGVQLFHVPGRANLDLIVDGLGVLDSLGAIVLFGPNNAIVGAMSFGQDMDVTPTDDSNYLLVLSSSTSTNLPYSFQIIPGNHAPVLASIGNRTNTEMTLLTFTASATDLEAPNDQLTFTLDPGAPAAASIHPVTGVFTWTPDETNGPGIYPVTVRVTDNGIPNFNDSETFNIVINEVNRAPLLFVPGNQTLNEFVAVNLSASATDPDFPTNVLTFSLISPPSGMTINIASGAIAWTPGENQGSLTNTITVVVSDTNPPAVNAKQLSVTNTFQIAVNEVNVAPQLPVQTNRTINELTLLTVTNTAADSDSPVNGLSYALTVSPSGATLSSNGVITWATTEAHGPSTNVFTTVVTDTNLTAVNAQNLTATNTFTVIVNELNTSPALSVQTNRTINELTTLVVTNSATDSDSPANGLGYTLTVFPPGATISSNGVITWTPTEAQGPSTNVFTTVVTDTNLAAVNAQNLRATNTFTVFVTESNVPPVLTLPPNAVINEQVFYTNNATATDADLPVNPRVFELVSGPSGLNVSTAGAITWTPTEAQGPGVYPVQIKVTDTNPPALNTTSLSVTSSFTLTVNEINLTPTLVPPANRTLHAGSTLSATATATDPDLPANALTFTKVSGPGSLTVSLAGLITWNTSDANANTTNLVTLRVTDNGTPNLSHTNSFVVTVRARPVFTLIEQNGGSATATWTAISGTSYRLQYRTNIQDTVWVDLAGDIVAGGATATKTDSTLGTNVTRFYRVFVLP